MKKFFLIIIFGAMIICIAGAQNFESGLQKPVLTLSLNTLSFDAMGSYSLQPDLMANGTGKPVIGIPIVAGLVNTFFGTWSWINKDWLGGGITAGVQIGGVVIMAIGMADNTLWGMYQGLIGAGVFVGGAVYGLIRGITQCKSMNSMAWTGNPFDHITAAVLPASDGGFTGNLTFMMSY